jgi:hypothetical protein
MSGQGKQLKPLTSSYKLPATLYVQNFRRRLVTFATSKCACGICVFRDELHFPDLLLLSLIYGDWGSWWRDRSSCHIVTRVYYEFVIVSTWIPRYKSNRFTSSRLNEMHKLTLVFQFMSQFLLIRASSSRKPIVVPGASSREVMENYFSFYEFLPFEQFWRNELRS